MSDCVQGRKDTYGYQNTYARYLRDVRVITVLYGDRSIVTGVRVYKASHSTALLRALDLRNSIGYSDHIHEALMNTTRAYLQPAKDTTVSSDDDLPVQINALGLEIVVVLLPAVMRIH